jgi:hypothetical protein
MYGGGGALLYKSFVDSANAPKKSLFYGANVNYADPRIYSQVGPNKFKVGQYDDQGNMTATSEYLDLKVMYHQKLYMLEVMYQVCLIK